jgi:hypothetical protein
MPKLLDEWPARREVLERAFSLLSGHKQLTAKELAAKIGQQGLSVKKGLVNSVLSNEGKRYVLYDRDTHGYSLRPTERAPGKFGELDILAALGSQRVRETPTRDSHGKRVAASRSDQLQARIRVDGMAFDLSISDGMEQELFAGSQRGAQVNVRVNRRHVAYGLIEDHLDVPGSSQSTGEASARQPSVVEAFFFAWAAYEHSLPEGSRIRAYASEARVEWGRQLRRFVSVGDED